MTQIQTSTFMQPEEIYNLIMGWIEPELTTETLPLLEELYEGESTDARIARGERYAKAFATFEEQYGKFVEGWKDYYTDIRKKAQTLKRKTVEQNEKDDTGSIEASLQQS